MANWQLDMRIPVVFGAEPEAGDAVLIEGDAATPAGTYPIRFKLPDQPDHPAGCACGAPSCCAPRGPVAEALGRAFRDRATGAAPFFTRVIAMEPSAAAMAAIGGALATDAMTAGRYRKTI
jgi:hypothetical protein